MSFKESFKIGDKVTIIWDELSKGYEKTIKKSIQLEKKKKAGFSESLARKIFDKEIQEMKEFEKENGEIRTICKIYYNNVLGKSKGGKGKAKIARYELDNDYVYYKNELIKVG